MDVYITKEGNQVDERPRCFNCGAYLLTEEKDACDYCKVEIMCLLLKAKISPVSPGRLKDLNETIVFRLKRFWQVGDRMVELYPAIKKGEKTSEWRDMTTYWGRRLIREYDKFNQFHLRWGLTKENLTMYLKVNKCWFTVGFPKNNTPRLEAGIVRLIAHYDTEQYEIQFVNVKEVKK